jgi:flagellar basal-body rod protein FlgF
MDRLIYTAMSGAKQALEQQATTSHNLANVSTSGFRAQLDTFRAVPVIGAPLATRAFVVDSTVGADFRVGTIQHTGRDLDVALPGQGWIAVEKADGSEGYSRGGSLKINENGVLQTQSGQNVLSDSGPISIPPDVVVSIAKDGTISTVEAGSKPGVSIQLARLKLVNPPQENLVRSDDGLFVTKDGEPAENDANVTVVGGAIESSNVNVVDAMVDMITLARSFELNMDVLKRAETNDAKATEFMALS